MELFEVTFNLLFLDLGLYGLVYTAITVGLSDNQAKHAPSISHPLASACTLQPQKKHQRDHSRLLLLLLIHLLMLLSTQSLAGLRADTGMSPEKYKW